LDVSN